jgi:hypothetical protein
MALKGDRHELDTDISYFMNEVGNRGGVVVASTQGSGAAMDQSVQLCTLDVPTSGAKALGILLNDMVNYDQTRQHINFYKDEVQKGSKVTILRKGWIVTDQIASGITITAGDTAYAEAKTGATATGQGRITNVAHATGGVAVTPKVGQFLSKADEDGYAKVAVNLP